ncbi:MAG: hypothetical protein GEV06_06220 [Luteitalea sp.]|nr:hypothetical protein [Luteitalea sp.]
MNVQASETDLPLVRALEAARAAVSAEIAVARGGIDAIGRYTNDIDQIVRRLYSTARRHTDTPLALVALGGYGRRQLCLHSDIDILVLVDGPIRDAEARFVRALLHPLWDLQLQVGHQVRELAELQQVDHDNPEFLLALLDARLLDGDKAVYETFARLCLEDSSPWRTPASQMLRSLIDRRHTRFNGTIYQLEPDVKEAPGALRDVTAIRALGPMDAARADDGNRLDEAEDFLFRIRSILHLERGRNANVLDAALQERVAALFGCPGAEPHHQVEALMSAYFYHARLVFRALEAAVQAAAPRPVERARSGLPRRSEAKAGENLELVASGVRFVDMARASLQPQTWPGAFRVALERGCPVSPEALLCIERHVGRYSAEQFLPTDAECDAFLLFLRPHTGLYDRLSEMHDCGLLGQMFPEFRKVYCRVIRDFFHKYTVDEHTLLTIRGLERLSTRPPVRWRRFAALLQELEEPEVLVFALVFHDVGKWTDGGHAGESVRLVQGPLARFQVAPDIADTVQFLIANHLEMSAVAFRRDIEDPQVVKRFANLVGTELNLKLLCLMTLVDIDAVGPDVLTPWQEDLLWRLYVDTYNYLTLAYGEEIIRATDNNLEELARGLPDVSEATLERFLDGLPRRYLRLVAPPTICEHVRLSQNIQPEEVHCALTRKHDGGRGRDIWHLTVVSLNKPLLFSNICGVLSYFGMDILRGQAMTNRHGLVLDLFEFVDGDDFLRLNAAADRELIRVLQEAVAGRLDVASRLRGKARGLLGRHRPRRIKPVVHFDEQYSQRHTILEIVADNAWGLLFRVSRVVSRHGCDIDLVLISTEGRRAIDVFHITREGRKLTGDVQRPLRAELLEVLAGARDATSDECRAGAAWHYG